MSKNINITTLTTAEFNKLEDFEITYGFVDSKFGPCIIGINKDQQVCYTGFFDEGKDNSAIDNLKSHWPSAVLKENNKAIKPFAEKIFGDSKVDVLLKGTDLQINVWKELVKLKTGATTSYGEIAKAIGKPAAVRAVATAIARNKVAFLIPCHRVIQKSGSIGKYGYGVQRKKDMLEFEKAN